MKRLTRILAIARKEALVLVRDRARLVTMLGTPMLILAIFGYALSGEVKNLPIAIWDQDRTAESRALIDAFQVSGYFVAQKYVDSYEGIQRLLDWGQVRGALVIPAGYAVAMERLEPIGVQFLLDGSDSATSGAIMSYATVIAQQHAANVLLTRVPLQSGIPSLDFRSRVWYNPDMSALDFNVPGLIGVVLQWTTMALTSLSITKEREDGTIEQLIATPLAQMELMVGKLIPYVVVAMAQVTVSLLVGVVWFGTRVAGSLTLFYALATLFLFVTLGMGLLISTISRTQREAQQLTSLIMLPTFMICGFAFPIDPMPLFIQAIANILPLTHFLGIIRGIFLKGVGLDVLWPQAAYLMFFGIVMMVLSAGRFKKKLE